MSVVTLLNAVSANTTGPVAGLGTPYGNLTLAVSTTGTVSAFSVVLQGSLDGFNWEAIGSAVTSPTAGTSMGTGVLFQYFQAVLSGYSGTGTVTAELAYSLEAQAGGGGPPSGAAGGVLTGTYPNPGITTLNQSTTGTAANLSGTPALPNGTAATTQTGTDNSTKLATTAFVQGAIGATPIGKQAAYAEITSTITLVVSSATTWTAFTGAPSITLPNDGNTYRIAFTPPYIGTTSGTSQVLVGIGTSTSALLAYGGANVGASGVPVQMRVEMQKITGSGQTINVYVYCYSTCTLAIDAFSNAPCELAAYRVA